ncbi:hypothetical protein CEXT_336321 [Caerostris extrusa]|uniref:Uncharacterized protein n=1 Tax=Caerostris extrusa TaxID=172846 RepID=A0AAV4UXR3_CAEEX|nr:hypothetical protein CEXT_336321 [Caerostris extrusa]
MYRFIAFGSGRSQWNDHSGSGWRNASKTFKCTQENLQKLSLSLSDMSWWHGIGNAPTSGWITRRYLCKDRFARSHPCAKCGITPDLE